MAVLNFWKLKTLFLFLQVTSYGYAYGRSRSGSHQNYYRSRSEADNDTRLKNLVRDIRTSLNNTRNFWTKLPYDVCKEELTQKQGQNGWR